MLKSKDDCIPLVGDKYIDDFGSVWTLVQRRPPSYEPDLITLVRDDTGEDTTLPENSPFWGGFSPLT